jgi:hypothetical protein
VQHGAGEACPTLGSTPNTTRASNTSNTCTGAAASTAQRGQGEALDRRARSVQPPGLAVSPCVHRSLDGTCPRVYPVPKQAQWLPDTHGRFLLALIVRGKQAVRHAVGWHRGKVHGEQGGRDGDRGCVHARVGVCKSIVYGTHA